MSIFGSGSAKFTRSGSTVTLENSVIRPGWADRTFAVNESAYDHYSTFKMLGDYSDFWVDMNLFDYGAPTDPTEKFDEIYPFYQKHVYFWPHDDGTAISGSDNNHVAFFIDDMQHNYVSEDSAKKDILSIHFTSVEYTSITGSMN